MHVRSRWRRSSALVAYWEDGTFVLENFLTGQRSAISPFVAAFLEKLGDYQDAEGLRAALRGVPGARGLARLLERQGLIVREGTAASRREDRLDEAWRWGREARYLHFASRRLEFMSSRGQARHLKQLAAREPPPPAFASRGPIARRLANRFDETLGALGDCLQRRRTCRSFQRKPIALSELTTILQWTWGRTRVLTDLHLGRYFLRTSPSGGARHPIEAYCLAQRVKGLPRGLYHYSVEHHALETVRLGDFGRRVVGICGGQPWLRDAAVLFFMTAVLERSMWKYRHGHAYRVVHLDAGHLGQTFHLVCTRLGLAPITFAAVDCDKVERLLGVDGIGEVFVYAAGAGHATPAPQPIRLQ